jgi:hypothetical protein
MRLSGEPRLKTLWMRENKVIEEGRLSIFIINLLLDINNTFI